MQSIRSESMYPHNRLDHTTNYPLSERVQNMCELIPFRVNSDAPILPVSIEMEYAVLLEGCEVNQNQFFYLFRFHALSHTD
jgi:hypothetical protein